MILDPWVLGLVTGHTAMLFIFSLAVVGAWQIYRGWDFESNSEKQYELEKKTYLVSTVMNFVLIIQMIMLFLLVLAADELSKVIPGAMCATGTLSSNSFGFPVLWVKIFSFFVYFIWLIMNHLDNQIETYPLVKIKYLMLICIYPFAAAEAVLLLMFVFNLNPTVITSCCGSIYNDASAGLGGTLAGASPTFTLSVLFIVVFVIFLRFLFREKYPEQVFLRYSVAEIALWLIFFVIAVMAIVSFVSTYIYEMLSHKCPFCFLKGEYYFIGIPIYVSLFIATAAGLSTGALDLLPVTPPIREQARRIQKNLGKIAQAGMLLFLIFSFSPFVIYYFRTGRLI
jgi:hypothetical protein